jgi:hypothetical protein
VSKKWYSFFVVTGASQGAAVEHPTEAPPGAPVRAADLVAGEPLPSAPAQATPNVELAVVYESAKIEPPAHGYTVLKVADMLQSEHIRALPPDVRRKSVLVALDAAGVKVDEVVQDAVRRDRALDTYERVLQQHVDQLAETAAAENRQLEEEIARRAAELRARIDENAGRIATGRAELEAWRAKKQQEEALIAEAVSYFVTENPITVSAGKDPRRQGESDVR